MFYVPISISMIAHSEIKLLVLNALSLYLRVTYKYILVKVRYSSYGYHVTQTHSERDNPVHITLVWAIPALHAQNLYVVDLM